MKKLRKGTTAAVSAVLAVTASGSSLSASAVLSPTEPEGYIDGWGYAEETLYIDDGYNYYESGKIYEIVSVPEELVNKDEEVTLVLPEKLGDMDIEGCEIELCYMKGQVNIVFPESYKNIRAGLSNKGIKSVEFRNMELEDDMIYLDLAGSSITEITLPPKSTIDSSMFRGCRQLKSFTYPDKAEYCALPYRCFENCEKLEKVVLPEDAAIGCIGEYAFMNDRALKEVILPSDVDHYEDDDGNIVFNIGDSAFQNCSSLGSLTIPADSETDIIVENEAFSGCESLKKIAFSRSAKSLKFGSRAFAGCGSFDTLDIPDGTGSITIGEKALSGTAVTALNADSRWDIGDSAFAECNALKDITLDGAKAGENAFRGCEALENVTVDSGAVLGESAVSLCPALKNIDIRDSGVVMNGAFNDCPALMTINGKPVFDSSTGELAPGMKDIIRANFAASDNIGFLNEYVSQQVKKTVSEIIKPDMNDMQKTRAVHDWLCENTVYATEEEQGFRDLSDASVFLLDSTTGEGYARVFNLLAHEAGLETCIVSSETHSWNIVKIGGLYFHVDTTWDDLLDSHKWFLKTDSETYDAGGRHKNWKLCRPSVFHEFQSEELPECRRSMGDAKNDGRINTADLVAFSRYLLGSGELEEDDVTVCDLNFDGSADTFDTVAFRNKLTSAL